MKILSIQNSKINTFKGIDKNDSELPKNNEENGEKIAFISPEIIQYIYGFRPYTVDKNKKGEEYIKAKNLIITPSAVDKYLRKEDGKIDNFATINFIRIYNELLKEKVNDSQERLENYRVEKDCIELYRAYSEQNPHKTQEEILQELANETSGIYSSAFSVLGGDMSLELVETVEQTEKENFRNIPAYAFEDTTKIFDLSKTKDGYDFSDIEGKRRFIQCLDEISYNFDNTLDEIPYSKKFLEALKDSDGVIDYQLGLDASRLTRKMTLKIEPEKYISALKKWYEKSPEHRYDILETARILDNTFFGWSATKNFTEQIVDLCFDEEGKFDIDKKNAVMEQVEAKDKEIGKYLKNYKNGGCVEYVEKKVEELVQIFN